MKTAISLPDALFEAADRLAARLRLSRSELYARALGRFVEQHLDEGVTRELDAVYSTEESSLDPLLARVQSGSLGDADDW